MRRIRSLKHRPSAAMLVALTALIVAMSGTAVAATGGDFLLGRANTATSLTSLSNSKGTALALSSADGKPPLTVSTSTQVPKLNASLLNGHPATAFLPAKGTAANAAELGGQPSYDYMTGDGQITHTAGTIPYNNTVTLNAPNPLSDAYYLQVGCFADADVTTELYPNTTINAWWLDQSGSVYRQLAEGDLTVLAINVPNTLVLQVSYLSFVVTTTISVEVNSSAQTCTYAAQSISDG
jgi:hypothetical protein